VKALLCKRCDVLLVPGSTSSVTVENASRGGKKPWAEVEVVRCLACGAEKRFPVGATRQKRKTRRGGVIDAEARQFEAKELEQLQEKDTSTPTADLI